MEDDELMRNLFIVKFKVQASIPYEFFE